mmetsp:Transcript_8136/g.10639  ORF Transcript_8136/g.10639 Transcript_8136/m.10639 type:complete len:195 (+) Transcript_8136:92-676(+)
MKKDNPKVKMTKEERRSKYTNLARERSQNQRRRLGERNLVCFHCRQRGHGVENCPQKEAATISKKCCYKCGSTEHGLEACPKKGSNQSLPFATCFICQQQGHLSSQCSNNENGIYVNGGCCKVCGSKSHLSKGCTEKQAKIKSDSEGKIQGLPPMENFDDLIEHDTDKPKPMKKDAPKKESEKNVTKKRRVVKF